MKIKLAQAELQKGGGSEDREERRDARFLLANKLHSIDSDLRMAQFGLKGKEIGSPEHTEIMDEINRLKAERNALVNRGSATAAPQAQPVVSGAPTIRNDAGEVMVLKDGKWVKQ